MKEPFLTPRLTGKRFDDHQIPLEFLRDLSVLEEMIAEVAKSIYLEEHKDRQRSPRSFTKGIELKLSTIDPGSAKPVISLVLAGATLFPPTSEEYFQRARDVIIQAIGASEKQQSPQQYLSEKHLSYFDRFGRSLRDGEAIEFMQPENGQVVKLTPEIRRRLVLSASTATEVSGDAIVRGIICEADPSKNTFQIQIPNGNKVKAPLTPLHNDLVHDACRRYSEKPLALIHGVGIFDRSHKLKKFEYVEEVSLLDPLDVPARLEELKALKNGWLHGHGRQLLPTGLDWLSDQFDQLFPEDLPLPHLFPTEEGHISAEWSIGHEDISLEIDLEGHTGTWHRLNLQTDAEDSTQFDFDQADEWTNLANRLRELNAEGK